VTTRRLAVVTAGLRQPSSTRLLADQLAAATTEALAERGVETDAQLIELRDHAHDITNNLLTGFPSTELGEVIDTVVRADGLITVTPIFTATYSGLFKSFYDVLEHGSLAGKPVLIAATGGSERHSLALEHAMRPLFSYLRTVVVPTAVYAAASDWGTSGDGASALSARIIRAAHELADLISMAPPAAKVDPYESPVPFTDLLAGVDGQRGRPPAAAR
jgi:FMN reductase